MLIVTCTEENNTRNLVQSPLKFYIEVATIIPLSATLALEKHYWVIPEKIGHTPTTEGMLENLTGGGVNGSGNPDGRGALNLKIHPRG